MGQQANAPARYRFGTFEFDRVPAELRKRGIRIKLQEQPYRILCILLDNAGEVITRDTLCRALWPADTFVEFERSLNAAIAKLRQALGDSAENPRFIETVARRGYRFIAPVEIMPGAGNAGTGTPLPAPTNLPAVSSVREISTPPATSSVKLKSGIPFQVATAFAVLAMLALVGSRFWHRTQRGETTLVQLTSGTGLTMDPAVSPDGRLLAYVSDRAGGRNLNIWMQQLVPVGTAVQLTHSDADISQPSFSPDGSKIVFRSTENGGGIYIMPAIGGEPKRLVPGGRGPRFSPDGRWIAYWTGVPNATALTGGEGGDIYVLPAGGGPPRRVGTALHYAGNPVWSPDSKSLMAFCPDASDDFAWCVISINGESSSRASIFESLKRQGFTIGNFRVPRLSQWTPGYLLFSAVYGDALNVWRMPVSKEGFSLGPAERLTSGTTLEASPLLTPTGNLIFTSLNLVQSIWSLPLEADRARITGELKRITDGPAECAPSISRDGRKLAFIVNQNARPNSELVSSGEQSSFQARLKDLSTGREVPIADGTHLPLDTQISHDGTLLAYTVGKGRRQTQILAIDREALRLMVGIEDGGKVWDWSADNKFFAYERGTHSNIHVHNVSSERDSLFLSKAGNELYQAKFAPDDRAVALVACGSRSVGEGCRLFVVPTKVDGTTAGDDWIAIDHPSLWDDKPRWSPDGSLLYFISDRDGQFCLWVQRLESHTKKLIGTPFPLHHFHNSRFAMNNVGTSSLAIDVAWNKIVLDLGELTGNIWSLKR